ncbi:MAG: Rrf2 family transcriptional regulator [Rubrobacteridae bacterium]|nr:Rrf2 family transcriptional regulator [Rubrobacteridae bacterium]
MQLTRRAEYAIRALLDIAIHQDEQPVMSKQIAARQDIPVKFLFQIIPDLKGAGLIVTTRGNGGGIYLNKRPDEVTIRQIVEAIEGPFAINQCLIGRDSCSRKPACPLHDVWRKAQEGMLSVLESTTLTSLSETMHDLPHNK